MDPKTLSTITELTITLIVLIVSAYVVPWLKTKIKSDKLEQVEKVCQKAVRAAEQLYAPTEWSEKKTYVRELVVNYAAKHNIDLNMVEIDAIIEGVVNYVKHNKNGGQADA